MDKKKSDTGGKRLKRKEKRWGKNPLSQQSGALFDSARRESAGEGNSWSAGGASAPLPKSLVD